MSFGRSILSKTARAFVTAPPVIGATYVLALAIGSGQRGQGDDADLGGVGRADAMATFIEHRFGSEVTRMKIGIAATAIALGLVIGLVVDLTMRLRGRRVSSARAFLEAALGCVVLHASLVAWSMAKSPQLYASRWYAQGGLSRTLQVLVTDVLGPWGVIVVTLAVLLAYLGPARLGRLVRTGRARITRLSAKGAAALLLLGAGAFVAASVDRAGPGVARAAAPSENKSPTRRPNVIVLAADSLRVDRLDPRVAPNLSQLADRGTRFDRAYVSIPRTFSSWVTILTGRHAHHHGVRSMFPTWEDRAKDFDALPARLARAGFATGVVSDYAGDIFGRIDLGFQRVDTPSFDFRQLIRQRALERETPLLPVLHSQLGRVVFPVMRELNDAADPMLLEADVEKAIDGLRGDEKPFFLTVFFSTAHFPYAAPAPYYAKFTDPAYRGRFKYHKPVGLGSEAPPDAEDVRQIQALYDGAVNAIDDAVGRLVKGLEKRGLADDTIIVVTADHGEVLFDDGHGQGHGDHLFGDQGTHVPLVVYDPRTKRHGREGAVVRDVDLAATIYELTGVAPPSDLDGRSLAPALRGEALEPRFAYAETELWFTEDVPGLTPDQRIPYPGIMALTELDTRHNAEIVLRRDVAPITLMARHRMIRDERYKLVYVPTRQGVKYILFDTQADPKESQDLSAKLPQEVTRLRAELWKWMLADPLMDQKNGYLVPSSAAFARLQSGGAP